MLDQDKLLMLMYDLGYPTDAVDAVKGLYTDATTSVKTAYGPTPPIPVQRGTIQGDSLSPFLFLLYIEPLLRWLQVGGRGYKFGCLRGEEQEKHKLSSLAYADDLAILAESLSQMKIQAEKLTQYSNWACMQVNHQKTYITAALYSHQRTGFCNGDPFPNDMLRRRLTTVQIQGHTPTYLPPTSSFTYLGVDISMSLDWRYQHSKAVAQMAELADAIMNSWASPRQVSRLIETCVRPKIAYGFLVAPYTSTDLDILDTWMRRIIRHAYKLMKAVPSALIHEDIENFGLGCTSLYATNAYNCISSLTLALNDQSTWGVVTRAILSAQLTHMKNLPADQLPSEARYCMRVRQLTQTHNMKIKMLKDDLEPYIIAGSPIITALEPLMHTPKAMRKLTKTIQPLLALGITSWNQLLEANGTHIISTVGLKNIFGAKVRTHHQRALNNLTMALSNPEYLKEGYTPSCNTGPMTHCERAVHPQCLQLIGLARPTMRAPAIQQSATHSTTTHNKVHTSNDYSTHPEHGNHSRCNNNPVPPR